MLEAGEISLFYGNGFCLLAAQQINGREGETATLLSRCFVSLNLRGVGFAPRHLKRSASFLTFTRS